MPEIMQVIQPTFPENFFLFMCGTTTFLFSSYVQDEIKFSKGILKLFCCERNPKKEVSTGSLLLLTTNTIKQP